MRRWAPLTFALLAAAGLDAATARPVASAQSATPAPTSPVPRSGIATRPATVTSPKPPLPPPRTVDAVLTDAIGALGGAAAIAQHHSLHSKMEITFAGLGISGTAEHFATTGDRVLSIMSIPNLASTREGGDGTHFWSDDPINGLRVLDGDEVEQARVEAAWNAELRTKELFPKIEVKNEWSEDGQVLECLVLTPKTGPAMTDCYDATTHLLSTQRGVRSGPQGDMPFLAKLRDWRTVSDMKIAYTTEMQVGPLSFVGRLTSVELDTAMDPALFTVPKATASDGAGSASGKSKSKSKGAKSGRATKTTRDPAR